jgi:hypothetical protein
MKRALPDGLYDLLLAEGLAQSLAAVAPLAIRVLERQVETDRSHTGFRFACSKAVVEDAEWQSGM